MDPDDIDKGEAVVKVKFDLTDTIFDVRDRMEAAIAAAHNEQDPGFANKLLSTLFSIPGLPTGAIGLVRLLDRHGIAPAVLMEELPLYVGMYLTNTASIGLHHVYHHLYNWGNVSLFLSIGLPERVCVDEGGKARMKRTLPIGIVADERICSGAHYARFFKDMKLFVTHPELLEVPPEFVTFDQGLEYHQPKS